MSYYPPPLRGCGEPFAAVYTHEEGAKHHSIRPFTTISAAKICFF